jgi:hypothetical protein
VASNWGHTTDSKRGRFPAVEKRGGLFCASEVAAGRGTGLALKATRDPATRLAHTGGSMNRKRTTKQDTKIRLALKKETLKDLSPRQNENVRGGFIMKDSIIVRTSGR